jgi:5-methylcytosine-specific restriction endonuclease McrA
MTKICSKCGRELPATSEYFSTKKASRDGLKSTCKECVNAWHREHYKANKEKISEQHKSYYRENKQFIDEKHRLWQEANPDKVKLKSRRFYDANKDIVNSRSLLRYYSNKEVVAARQKEYRLQNKEYIAEYHRRYYLVKKDYISDRCRKYQQTITGQEVKRNHYQKRRAIKRGLACTLTKTEWQAIVQHFNGKCAYCGKELPLTQDHFIALSKGGAYTHNNIVPACMYCNSKKSAKSFFDWYPKQDFYSKKREKEILSFLGYQDGVQAPSLFLAEVV